MVVPESELERAAEPLQQASSHSSVRGRFRVFISHADAQKNFALWVRSHVRTCGYQAFVDERDLQCGLARQPSLQSQWGSRKKLCSLACLVVSRPRHGFSGSTPCKDGNDAPKEMESALRGAAVVLVVVTKDFLRSKFCLDELHWACDEMQRRSQQA